MKLEQLKEKRYRYWTKEELVYLKSNYGKIIAKKIALKLKRGIIAVYSVANRLGLSSKLRKNKLPSEDKI